MIKLLAAVITVLLAISSQSNLLTSSKILNSSKDSVNNLEASLIELTVLGDIMPGRYVNVSSINADDNFWAYRNISEIINSKKLVFANLESPITKNCKPDSSSMIFCAPPYAAESLSKAGVDIVSLANNHALNQGPSGIKETIEYLELNNIKHTGISNPTYIEIDGRRLAFLGFDEVECNSKYIECADKDNIVEDITVAKKTADFIVIMFHWGTEYTYKQNSKQVDLARFSIDSGADLILGNHPHWYQGYEEYKDKFIMYSHGNFVFDQMWSRETREGLIGDYKIDLLSSKTEASFTPIVIENYGQPKLYDQMNTNRIKEHLKSLSLTQN